MRIINQSDEWRNETYCISFTVIQMNGKQIPRESTDAYFRTKEKVTPVNLRFTSTFKSWWPLGILIKGWWVGCRENFKTNSGLIGSFWIAQKELQL